MCNTKLVRRSLSLLGLRSGVTINRCHLSNGVVGMSTSALDGVNMAFRLKMLLKKEWSKLCFPCRTLHTTHSLEFPRFKLNLEDDGTRPTSKRSYVESMGTSENEKQSYLNTHPYRKLCPWKSKSELATYLVEQMLLNDYGLFVTNKPFGVGVRKPHMKSIQNLKECQLHLRGVQTCPYTLEDLLPELREMLKKPNLVLARSTEKLTSGIAVFTDDEKIGQKFHEAYKKSHSYYDNMFKYHLVTTLIPVVSDESTVERLGITIKTGIESDIGQPVLIRQFSKNSMKRRDVAPVHVQTRILRPAYSLHNEGCLVEVNTNRITNNFLRIYCADKLAPLLGDHLYSDRVRLINGIPAKIDPAHLAPGTSYQRLSKKMLELLELRRPEDSIMVPTHAHLRSYQIRKFLDHGAELMFEAPYPDYFRWTCQKLGIILDADSFTTTVP